MRDWALVFWMMGFIAGCGEVGSTNVDGASPDGSGAVDMAPPPSVVVSRSSLSKFESETSLAVASNGDIAVAWIGITAALDSHIGYTFSKDGGRSWSDVAKIGKRSTDPVLATAPAGDTFLAWLDVEPAAIGVRTRLYVARAPAGASAFNAPIEVTDPNESLFYDKPSIAITAGGRLLLTYTQFSSSVGSSPGTLMVASSRDGIAWNRQSLAGGIGANIIVACAPAKGSRVYTVLSDYSDAGITLRWSDDEGVTWPPASRTDVFPGDQTLGDPKCAAREDSVWVLDGIPDNGPANEIPPLTAILLGRSVDRGKSFTRSSAEDPLAGGMFQRPQLIVESSGAVGVSYYAAASIGDAQGTLRYGRADTGAPPLASSVKVAEDIYFSINRADSRWLGDYTGLAEHQGRVMFSFADNSAGDTHIVFRGVLP